jgi:peptidoglycan/LPS O-acetylase OafA/YrhL
MRLITIDFLRGIAVLLVISRHLFFKPHVLTIGWIGVDLFFVLSGFLVSNLLFQEYNTTENIKPWRFLIRRGLKIYPLFYIMVASLFFIFISEEPESIAIYKTRLINEVLFIQNYRYNMTLIGHTWSLAVEEHFYFILTFVFFIFARFRILNNKILFNTLTGFILLSCMYMRYNLVASMPNFPLSASHSYLFPTHFRFDTLWVGVFIAFHYNYSLPRFKSIFSNKKWLLFSFISVLLPLFFPLNNPFLAILGLTIIALCFGITLATLIIDDKSEALLAAIFGKRMLYLLAKIGTYSYGIYLFHMTLIVIVKPFSPNLWMRTINTLFVFLLMIIVGIISTELIEKPILKWRNKHIK